MSHTVSIVLKLKDSRQSFYFEQELRKMLDYDAVISYANLPDTSKLYEDSTAFKKLVKAVKTAQWERDTYINEHN